MDNDFDNVTCSVALGTRVPDFEMDTYDPRTKDFGRISLEKLTAEGKWTVLVFYPADFTFVCPTELADVARVHDQIAAAGAQVVGVSTDTQYTHMAWLQSEKLLKDVRFPLAADPTGNVSSLFGVYDENTGLALRGTFFIDPEGTLVGSEVNFYNVGRNADELVRKLRAFAHVATHPDEACPARWDEGAKTLTPGKNLVGKVFEAL